MTRATLFSSGPKKCLSARELRSVTVFISVLLLALCTISAEGQNPPPQITVSLDQLKVLAEKGNAEAQLKLANMLRTGKDAAHNVQEAAKWYRKAAEQGSAEAQFKLGELLLEGKGVAQNIQEALTWLEKSGAQGFKAAKDKLSEVKSKAQDSVKDLNKALDLIR